MPIRLNYTPITLLFLIDGLILTLLSGVLAALVWFNLADISSQVNDNLATSTQHLQQTQVLFSQQLEMNKRINTQEQHFNHLNTELSALLTTPDTAAITPAQIHAMGNMLDTYSLLLLQTWAADIEPTLRGDYNLGIKKITQQTDAIGHASSQEWLTMAKQLQQTLTHVSPLVSNIHAADEQVGAIANNSLQSTIRTNKTYSEALQINLQHIRTGSLWAAISIILLLIISRIYFSIRFKRLNEEARLAQLMAEEAVQTKARFLATMSHEIRTPMNGVIGMTRLLMNTPMSKKQTEFVESIYLSGEHLLTVINDVLDFSKMEAGKLDIKHEPLEIRACIEDVLNLLSSKALEKNLELAYAVSPAVPLYIEGDIVRLRQILTNLLGNAIKFTERGEVTVFVSSHALQNQEYELEFQINDTGPGIPRNRLESIFEQFSRVDDTRTHRQEGTGLGLAISRRLVEMMEGRIWAESELGSGSRFHFTLKTRKTEGKLKPYLQLNIPEIRGKRILIVENNPANCQSLQDFCFAWGAKADTAKSAAEAIGWLAIGKVYDLALVESNLPGDSALKFAQYLRSHHSKQAWPLILIAPPNDRHPKAVVREFYNLYLTKPITRSRLFDSLMTVLGECNSPANSPTLLNKAKLGEALPLKILLAEDNPINQMVATSILEEMQYTADIAENGVEVLAALRKKPYDIIFMDMQMPEMDGLTATRHIRADFPPERQPIIIAMTANAMDAGKQNCLDAGMNDYISKPILPETVEAALQRWCINRPPVRGNSHEITSH